MADPEESQFTRRKLQRSRSNFLTRTATDDAARLDRRLSMLPQSPDRPPPPRHSDAFNSPYEPQTDASKPVPRQHSFTKKVLGIRDDRKDRPMFRKRSSSGRRKSGLRLLGEGTLTAQMYQNLDPKGKEEAVSGPRPGAMPRPIGGTSKLGTFSGVFVPTTLNVLSILMFLRFGFILGQSGVLGMLGMLVVSYMINLVTTLSISAIATNGTVRGGGAYYLISRSLGPEFGGSIGVVFYLGFVFNTGMNAVGLIDCLRQNFGQDSGNWAQLLPEGFWWDYLWATVILLLCTTICLAGSGIFARCSNGLLAILLIATLSIPFSTLVMQPFRDGKLGINYTGPSLQTFKDNLLPHFTKHAAGSQLKGRENFQDLFGILFPATGGIFAGASMSGDLKHPSKAIPKGTLYGLALTFVAYALVILAMASSITRNSFYENVNIIQDTNMSGVLILLGEFSTSFFSSLMGVIGSAKLLQALARDRLLPGFSIFGQGTKGNDEPTYAIIFTYIVAQLTMLCDINQIASFVTMTYLMTFLVTNLACFLLDISSAPNFRPSFHYFDWWTAAFGTLISGACMFFVDGLYATGCVGILIVIFLIIHYFTPPKSWGDVSQSLIYHQVRKYLLRLRQEHVKFWRPQILLFINDPRHQYKLIQFCNSLKKGALFILGHVIVAQDFGTAVPEARRQQAAWTKYIDFSKVKAFINIAISPAVEWGTRNIVLSSGLGGMRPNIVIMGFYNLDEFRDAKPLIDVPSPQNPDSSPFQQKRGVTKRRRRDSKVEKLRGALPTDECRTEGNVGPVSYVTILEDLLLKLQINVAIAKGFKNLEFPHPKEENTKKYIDLWPIQMSAEIAAEGGDGKQNLLTTNFDTYTLILQLGCILNTVPAWKKVYRLRVAVFVEYESDVEEERGRVQSLLQNLRMEAEVLVFWLASGDIKTYQVIVNGDSTTVSKEAEQEVDDALKDEEWWQDVQRLRGRRGDMSASEELADMQNLLSVAPSWPTSSFRFSREPNMERFHDLRKMVRTAKRRHSSGSLSGLGVRLGMTTHRLDDDLVNRHASHASASEDSDSSTEDDDSVFVNDSEEGESSEDAASENDIDDLKFDDDTESSRAASPFKINRRRSDGETLSDLSSNLPKHSNAPSSTIGTPSLGPTIPEDTLRSAKTSIRSLAASSSSKPTSSRRKVSRRSSAGKFSSRPTPRTQIASHDDGPGPSIMFTDSFPTAPPNPQSSIYNRANLPGGGGGGKAPASTGSPPPTSGFPAAQSLPLGFNDLPCRAQHLILNELMRANSGDTAVLFTTLPSPVEGTWQSEEDCVGYLSDLEVLCEGLPPVLLVHSNSMTVTMSL